MHPVIVPGGSRAAFADVSTTGPCSEMHEIWEAALILRADGGEHQYTWQLPVNLERTDPSALERGRFYERRLPSDQFAGISGFVDAFTDLTAGAHLVGVRAEFTAEFVRRLLRRNGRIEGWCHLVDVSSVVAGRLAAPPPWNLVALSSAVGVDPDRFATDTALGNARWAKGLYDAVVGVRV